MRVTPDAVIIREGEGFAEVGRFSGCKMAGEQQGFLVFPRGALGLRCGSGGLRRHSCPSLEIDCRGGELECGGVTAQASISGARKTVDPLEQGKEWLHRSATMPENRISAYSPCSQTMPAAVPAHDAITDTHRLQSRSANLAIVSLVGINRGLISADQGIGYHSVVDVGGREVEATNNAAVLVHPHMHLVAEEVLVLLPRPGGVRVVRAFTNLLAGRPSGSGDNAPSGGSGGFTAERTSEASISVPRFKTKPDFSICAVIRLKARSARPLLANCSRKRQRVE